MCRPRNRLEIFRGRTTKTAESPRQSCKSIDPIGILARRGDSKRPESGISIFHGGESVPYGPFLQVFGFHFTTLSRTSGTFCDTATLCAVGIEESASCSTLKNAFPHVHPWILSTSSGRYLEKSEDVVAAQV